MSVLFHSCVLLDRGGLDGGHRVTRFVGCDAIGSSGAVGAPGFAATHRHCHHRHRQDDQEQAKRVADFSIHTFSCV